MGKSESKWNIAYCSVAWLCLYTATSKPELDLCEYSSVASVIMKLIVTMKLSRSHLLPCTIS